MKKILSFIILLMSTQHLVMAQGGPGMGRQFDPARMVAAEKQLLLDSVSGLNDDQKLIIEAIYDDYLISFEEARKDMNPDNREAMRATMGKIRDAKNEALKEILTEDQLQSFKEMLARRRDEMQKRRQNRNE